MADLSSTRQGLEWGREVMRAQQGREWREGSFRWPWRLMRRFVRWMIWRR
jgi:hypothetical protein